LPTIDLSMAAGLPGLLALIVCFWQGPEAAFLNVYLPMLLLLPDQCRMPLSGQFNFSEAAIIPIAATYLLKYGRYWRWSFTDLLVLAFVSMISIGEYQNADYVVAQNLTLRMLVSVVMPYIVAKGLIFHEDMSIEVAKRIVILVTAVAVISVFEFKMTVNPFRAVFASFFPRWVIDIPSFRYGVARISGPWTHPILAGIILAVGYRIARWLDWTSNWPGNVPFLSALTGSILALTYGIAGWSDRARNSHGRTPVLSITKVRFCEIALLGGCVMTISRGPWFAAGIAALVVMFIRARHRKYVGALLVFVIVIVSLPAYTGFENYLSVSRFGVSDPEAQSAAYRREMMSKYVAIAEERPTFGWGQDRNGKGLYPVVEGMVSIDNQYLLLALNFGVYALGAMVLILLWVPIRLCRLSFRNPHSDINASLAVTLLGIFIVCGISMATVYLGAQTEPIFFLVVGWSEALLGQPLALALREPASAARSGYGFERVMA
jgi:hypothetical protein